MIPLHMAFLEQELLLVEPLHIMQHMLDGLALQPTMISMEI